MVVNDESDGQVIFSFIFESSPVFLHQRHYDGFLLVFPPVYSEVILRVGLKAAKIVETSTSIFSRNPGCMPFTLCKLSVSLQKKRPNNDSII